jgi:hypothetical protein
MVRAYNGVRFETGKNRGKWKVPKEAQQAEREGRRLRAQHPFTCGHCSHDIRTGDPIAKYDKKDHRFWHLDCVRKAKRADREADRQEARRSMPAQPERSSPGHSSQRAPAVQPAPRDQPESIA